MAANPVPQPPKIQEGRYTLVYPDGQYRTVWIKYWAGPQKLVLKIKQGNDWEPCGFLQPYGSISFWQKFRASVHPEKLQRIQVAVNRILADPERAGLSYAMHENRCYRCGRELTVPASIHKGMGPECARRAVTKDLNKQAYTWRAGQGKPAAPVQTTIIYPATAPDPVSSSSGAVTDTEWIEQKNQFADREQEQEAKAAMRDPDMFNPEDKFWSEECKVCKVPRYRCSC